MATILIVIECANRRRRPTTRPLFQHRLFTNVSDQSIAPERKTSNLRGMLPAGHTRVNYLSRPWLSPSRGRQVHLHFDCRGRAYSFCALAHVPSRSVPAHNRGATVRKCLAPALATT